MNKNMRIFIPCHSPVLFGKAEHVAKTGDGVVCAILCAAAVEAYIHDLVEWYGFSVKHNDKCESFSEKKYGLFEKKPPQCFSFSHALTEIEKNVFVQMSEAESQRVQVKEKLSHLRELIGGGTWDKGSKLFQEFSLLIIIRNSIVHMKGVTLKAEIIDGAPTPPRNFSGQPRFVEHLKHKKLLKTDVSPASWIYLIDTNAFCDWCLNTAFNITREISQLLPNTTISERFKENARFI